MLRHAFSDEDRHQIDVERYYHPDPRVMKRKHVLSLMMRGMKLFELVKYSKVSRSTIDRVRHIYATQGLEGVRAFHEKGPNSALEAHRTCLETELREHPSKTVGEARDRIEKLTGICAVWNGRGGPVVAGLDKVLIRVDLILIFF